MRYLLALLVLAACGDDGGAPADDPDADPDSPWRAGPAVPGGTIQETGAVALDGRIYVIGGFAAGFAISGAVRVFDTETETWSDGPELPVILHHANAAVLDGTIYVVGALRNTGFDASGAVYSYNPLTDAEWTVRTPMPVGTQRGASVAGAIDGRIVVAGGRLASTNSRLVWAFEDGAWVERAPMPTGRSGTGCGVVGGELIVVGGEGNPDASNGVFAQAEAYDPATDTWRTLEPMPTPRHGMGAAAWGGSLYVPGGATVQGFAGTDVHEILTPSP